MYTGVDTKIKKRMVEELEKQMVNDKQGGYEFVLQ